MLTAENNVQNDCDPDPMSEKSGALSAFGWFGATLGLTVFLLIHDEMAALLFWIGLGMLAHASSPRKELPLWNVFVTAKHPFVLAFVLALIGAPLFWVAHSIARWFVRDLFEPLGALVVTLAVASFIAAAFACQAENNTSSS